MKYRELIQLYNRKLFETVANFGLIFYHPIHKIDLITWSEANGNLVDWLIQNDKAENDHLLVDEKYELPLSDIIKQYNSKVVLKTEILELVFIER